MSVPQSQRTVEAYRRRVRELRAEQRALANDEGEQGALPIPLAPIIDIRPAGARRRSGWVKP